MFSERTFLIFPKTGPQKGQKLLLWARAEPCTLWLQLCTNKNKNNPKLFFLPIELKPSWWLGSHLFCALIYSEDSNWHIVNTYLIYAELINKWKRRSFIQKLSILAFLFKASLILLWVFLFLFWATGNSVLKCWCS